MEIQNNLKSQYSSILAQNGIKEEILEVVTVEPANLIGEHMGSKIDYVTIKFLDRSKTSLELFVKRPAGVADPLHAELFHRIMLKEGKFLTELVGDMEGFCKEKIEDENGILTGMFPKAFYSDKELLVLENIASPGYFMTNKSCRQDWKQAKLVLESLARFHCVSHILIQRAGGTNEAVLQIYQTLVDVMFSAEAESLVSPTISGPLKLLHKMVQASNVEGAQEAASLMEKYLGDIFKFFVALLEAPSVFLCVNHGDCWNNNMMFSKNHDHVTYVDLQCNRVASPCADIGYYLFTSTRPEVLREWKQLLRIYYEEFKITSSKLGYPAEELLTDFASKCQLGFIVGLNLTVGTEALKSHDAQSDEFRPGQFESLICNYVKEYPEQVEGFVKTIIQTIKIFQDIRAIC